MCREIARFIVVLTIAIVSAAGFAIASTGGRLADAAKARDTAAVRELLKQQVDVNAIGADGATALHWAVEWDDLAAAELLIHAGANVNVVNGFGVTPLSLACTNASVPMILALLKAGANPNAALPTGETPLMTAVATGDVEAVKALLDGGAKIDAKEASRGQTALMWAAADGHADIAQLLIGHGADVHARSASGFTALLFAARAGDVATTKSLLAAGTDVNESVPNGTTPLTVAIGAGRIAFARFLLEHGANVNPKGNGATPLQTAVLLANIEPAEKLDFVKALLTHGANPNARVQKAASAREGGGPREPGQAYRGNSNDATPFLIAARNGDVNLMRLLVANGADPKAPTSRGITPLMAAAGFEQNAIRVSEAKALAAVKLCVELGNDVNATSANGETALHAATLRENEDSIHIVQYLVDQGAKVNVMDARGWTPLTIAEGLGFAAENTRNPETAELLRKLGAIPSPPDYDRNTGLYFQEISFPPGMEPSGSSPNIKPALPGDPEWKAPVVPDRKTRPVAEAGPE